MNKTLLFAAIYVIIICGCATQNQINSIKDNKVLDVIVLKGLIKTYEEGQPSIDSDVTEKYSNSNYILTDKSLKYLKRYKSYEHDNIISYIIVDVSSEPNDKGVVVSYNVTFSIDKHTGKLIRIDSIEEISIEDDKP
ncbi:MAG: hypothetical protein ACYTFY_08745 [Planctomycetota bacterium]